MKLKEKQLAIKLRLKGYSLKEICKKTGFAKGSVSVWVRNVKLTSAQVEKLYKKGSRREIVERRRFTRLSNEFAKRSIIIRQAEKDVKKISKSNLFLIGVALYWAEGRKTAKGIVGFSNGDSRTIKLMMKFFNEICNVPCDKFRGYIHIHPHLDVIRAEKYWSEVSGIPLSQFYKTYRKPNTASLGKKDSLPFGTFEICICSSELLLKMQGWINGVCKKLAIN